MFFIFISRLFIFLIWLIYVQSFLFYSNAILVIIENAIIFLLVSSIVVLQSLPAGGADQNSSTVLTLEF